MEEEKTQTGSSLREAAGSLGVRGSLRVEEARRRVQVQRLPRERRRAAQVRRIPLTAHIFWQVTWCECTLVGGVYCVDILLQPTG